MEWVRAMRLFVSVVQNGSLSSAGRQYGLSPASVSRLIYALEANLGGRLLNRSTRKLSLTEVGELYFQQVERILHQLAEANDSVARLQTVPRGRLRVHSRMLVGQQYIVPALPRFLARNPEIKLDLLLSNHNVDLVESNIDVDIRIGKLTDSSLVARKLAASERIVCASPTYLDEHPAIRTPLDLAAHNCLTYRLDLGRTVWRFIDPDGLLAEVPVNGTFQSDNGAALLYATLAGVGIGLMPDWAIRDDLAAGRLCRLFADHQVSHIEFENGVYAVYQQTHKAPAPAKVRVFVDFAASLFKENLLEAPAEPIALIAARPARPRLSGSRPRDGKRSRPRAG